MGRSAASGRKSTCIVALAMLIAGVVVSVVGGMNLKNGLASSSWPQARGTVTSSSVSREEKLDRETHRTRVTYQPDVTYRYQVDGRSYASDRISFGDFASSSRGRAEEIVARYPRGMTVTVRTNPEKAGMSVLETRLGWFLFLPPAMGALFIGLGIFILRVAGKKGSVPAAVSPRTGRTRAS